MVAIQEGGFAAFDYVNHYRQGIRHIVFVTEHSEDANEYQFDWDWQLKVKWDTLPKLETLVLDLRQYSSSPRWPIQMTAEVYDTKIKAGARAIECLNLKLLVIYGLCSGDFFENKQHQARMQSLFERALHKYGKLVFKDSGPPLAW